ncbi:MAG: nucleoside phosphorylase [Thermodesulfobacteriota bacterium]|nr:nucleoside phosphorylase [Thermodesulfobacteriota bacterium]
MNCQALPSRNDKNDGIVIPVKGKNSPNLGPVAVMVSAQADLGLFCHLIDVDESKYRNLLVSRLYAEKAAEAGLAVVGPFVGAPYAVMLLETLIAWGAKQIIFFGWCGAISRHVKIGDIIIPTGAIVDEGTSKHYHQSKDGISLPSSYILKNTKQALTQAGLDFHQGMVWSTDAIYRETGEKVKYYQEKDVLAVEMELSALFTVGKFRHVQMGGILVVSDELSTLTWRPGFRNQQFKESRMSVAKAIIAISNVLNKDNYSGG